MFWLHVYEIARRLLGYSAGEDWWAARVAAFTALEASLRGAYVDFESLCQGLKGTRVCVVGASSGVEEEVEKLNRCKVLAADGVTTLLLSQGVTPYAVFTDFDGSVEAVSRASREGAIVVAHFHGDNYGFAAYASRLAAKLHVTIQYPYFEAPLVTVLGGFTDGDRAVAAALLCGASSITLYGMRFWRKVSRYSKPWLTSDTRPWPEKKRKLLLAVRLVTYLAKLAEALGVKVAWA